VQGETVADEVAGEADGTPNQMVTLQRAPVIAGSVAVRVTEPGGVETRWEQVETLSASEPLDRHFVVQRDSDGHATLVFGDGINGMAPPAGLSSSPTTIYATYRVGGGTIGNVPANSAFRSSLALIRQATNPTAAAGGTPKESLDRARFFAPRLYRTQERAVTAPDYAVLARQVAGVGKARAVALSWNQIALYVAPTGEGVAEPSELLKRDLLAAFESRRMAAVQVRILPARPADIYITATVQAQPYFLQDDVRDAVEGAVMAYLSFESVDFAQAVYLSRIYDVIQSLPSVISVNITEFSTAPYSQAISSDGTIQADPDQIPRLGYLHNPTTPPTPGVPESRRALRLTIEGGVAW
jgi:predicted phage baseplate assembly protein